MLAYLRHEERLTDRLRVLLCNQGHEAVRSTTSSSLGPVMRTAAFTKASVDPNSSESLSDPKSLVVLTWSH
jgi:hypothetical protein